MLLINNYIYCQNIVSRDNIESAHSDKVDALKHQYSDEEKETIEQFKAARRLLKTEKHVQELNGQMMQEETDLSGNYYPQ